MRIDPLSRSSKTARVMYREYIKDGERIFFIFQLRENKNTYPVWEESFFFPSGGVDSYGAKGGLAVDMVFFMEENEIKYFMTTS